MKRGIFKQIQAPRRTRLIARLWPLAIAAGLLFGAPAQAGTDGNRELKCLALNIYFEARSEPVEGKYAVGHVVMNRVANRRFPGSVCKVIRQGGEVRRNRCQFSWWCDGRSDQPRDTRAWEESRRIAELVYIGASNDPTDGALWYHADYVRPNWRSDFQRGPKIGRHVFYQIDRLKRRAARSANISPDARTTVASATEEKMSVQETDDSSRRILSLFGLGLVGLGFTRRRRKQAK